MRAVILDGSAAGDEVLGLARESLSTALDASGWEVEAVTLRDLDIAWCAGCFGCWVKTPGLCVVQDDSEQVSRSFIGSHLAVYLTRVTFGGFSSILKKAVDRAIGLGSPLFQKVEGEVHHRKRYERYPSLVAVGALERPDTESEAIFARLLGRNALNAFSPGHAAGFVYDGQARGEVRAAVRDALARAGVRP